MKEENGHLPEIAKGRSSTEIYKNSPKEHGVRGCAYARATSPVVPTASMAPVSSTDASTASATSAAANPASFLHISKHALKTQIICLEQGYLMPDCGPRKGASAGVAHCTVTCMGELVSTLHDKPSNGKPSIKPFLISPFLQSWQ